MKYDEKKFWELMEGKCYGAQEAGGDYYPADMWTEQMKNFHPEYEEMEIIDADDVIPYVELR